MLLLLKMPLFLEPRSRRWRSGAILRDVGVSVALKSLQVLESSPPDCSVPLERVLPATPEEAP